MLNGSRKGIASGDKRMGVVGIQEIKDIDQLIKLYREHGDEVRIPTRLVIDVLCKELSSREFRVFLKKMPMKAPGQIDVRQTHALLRTIPAKLYFFLWSLRNSDSIPVKGILTSAEIRRALVALTRFLNILESLLERNSNSVPLFENLGFTYFDLAGIAFNSSKGIYLNGRYVDYTLLLRKAIACFQCAIRLGAQIGRELDASHQDILKLIDDKCDVNENRANLYLDPWHFIYISSALHLLNDGKMSELYLRKARMILNSIDSHQNPRIVAQKDLLESIYTTIHFGKSVRFDFGQTALVKLQQKLNHVRKQKKSPRRRHGYSPMVEGALAKEFQVQREFRKSGSLQSDQKLYLNGVYTLYKQKISPLDRDKIIFRLNIPPVRISGLHDTTHTLKRHGVLPARPERKKSPTMELVEGKTYRAAS